MPDIEIYDETWTKLQEFKKIPKSILQDGVLDIDSDYIDLVLRQGLQKMIEDVLPQDTSILTQDIGSMFSENPKYVSQHIFETLEKGKEPQESQQIKEKWQHYQ